MDSLLWKVDFKEIQMHENEKENNSQQKQTRVKAFLKKISMKLNTKILNRQHIL